MTVKPSSVAGQATCTTVHMGNTKEFYKKKTIFTFEQAHYCQNFTHILKMVSKIRIC